MSKLKIGVIIGATRDSRFGHVPAQWIYELAKADPSIDAELVDLKSFDLPMFNEMASNAWMRKLDCNVELETARRIRLINRFTVDDANGLG